MDCCVRFYNRQFTTEHVQNQDIFARFEQLVDEYFNSSMPLQEGVPTVSYCADKLHLSTNYFNDLIRQSSGLSALKLMHRRMLDIAKAKLSVPSKRIGEIAGELGFQQPQNFSNWFKKMEGCTPQQYRTTIKA
ncbi:AraC family transcriptional regulator [Bacteroides ovatus]|uniref:helix-turn-helix domain-containing protein n=1 Tax=Bacteroides ovatus TaxID=28116 RepID=UPI00216516F9|nr:helix-turn-helix domain-containing protein [Bacteroides ovatus]MCS2299324.1 helix-turn-helix domain-containing protein [Bacteroides ovatus]